MTAFKDVKLGKSTNFNARNVEPKIKSKKTTTTLLSQLIRLKFLRNVND